MFELLFLLLPVAALYGYFMGRSTSKQKRENDKNRQDSIYLKGFDYLLSNKQDKAVDKFIAYLNSIDQTYESSLALGNLFRQQGEVDKAISLHEKMSNDSSLDESEFMASCSVSGSAITLLSPLEFLKYNFILSPQPTHTFHKQT